MSKLGVAIGISPSFGAGQEGGGISYLLFDDFLSALTAGNVDGTDAEPTGGARDVTDTDSVIDIVSGSLGIGAIATAGWGNHYIRYTSDSLQRIAGRLMLTKVTFADTANGNVVFGLGSISDTRPTYHAIYYAGTYFETIDETHGLEYIYDQSQEATSYVFAILLRSSGAFYYVNKNSSGYRLVAVTSTFTSTPLYPNIASFNQKLLDIDWIKIPESLYLPTPVYSNGFPTSAATIADSGSNGYDLAATNVRLNGEYARFMRAGGAVIPVSSSLAAHAIMPHSTFSMCLRIRKHNLYTRGTVFRVDKSDGSYITLHTNQFGDWQLFANTDTFINIGMPAKASLNDNNWHGIAFFLDGITADEGRSYVDGVHVGTDSGLGTFTTQNWTTTYGIGFGGLGSYGEDIKEVIFTLNGVLMTEAQALVLSDTATTITTTLLDSYFGAGNYAFYKLDDLPSSDGLGHAETSGLGAGGDGVVPNATGVNSPSSKAFSVPRISTATDILSGDGSMEGIYDDESGGGGGTVNIPPNWNSYQVETDGTDTVDKDTTTYLDGSESVKITVDAADEGIEYPLTGLVTDGVWYEAYGYIQMISGTAQIAVSHAYLGERSRTETSTAWELTPIRWMAGATAGTFRIMSSGGAATFNADHFSIREADISSFLHDAGAYGTDLYMSANLTTASKEGSGLFAFCDSLTTPTEMVYAHFDRIGSNVTINEMIAGVTTIKVQTAITYSAGTALVLVTDDTSGEVRCYYGTTLVGSFTRNSALTGNVYAGLFGCCIEPTFDNFVVYNTTSADDTLSTYE